MKFIRLLSIVFSLLIVFSINAYAETAADKVRVGLFYLNSSVNSVELSSDTGLEIGYNASDKYYSILTNKELKYVNIKKDNDSNNNQAFHIQVGNTYSGYTSAMATVNKFIQNNFNAYPVFENGWRVYVGIYGSNTLANADIAKFKKTLSTYSYSVVTPASNRIRIEDGTNKVILLYQSGSGNLLVKPIEKNSEKIIGVNGVKYRGDIEVIRQDKSDMTVINIVPLEEYLYSVVASEMPTSWNIEALKAQAVSARNYVTNVLLNVQKGKGAYISLGIDLNGTTEFQVYKGYAKEGANSRRAVNETKGLIAYYDGTPIAGYFFSSSGGYTENSENVWVSTVSYLKAVEDKYLPAEFPKKNWVNKATPQEIKEYLASKDVDIGEILDVRVDSYSNSGNALIMKIIGTKGEKEYKKDNIRIFMRGYKESEFLYSQNFVVSKEGGQNLTAIDSKLKKTPVSPTKRKVISRKGVVFLSNTTPIFIKSKLTTKTVSSTPETFVFTGKGYGHGVGMSQWGAKGMADAGFKFDEILKHYYTGIQVK